MSKSLEELMPEIEIFESMEFRSEPNKDLFWINGNPVSKKIYDEQQLEENERLKRHFAVCDYRRLCLAALKGKMVVLSDVSEGNLYSVLTKYFPVGVDASVVNKCARAVKVLLVSKAVTEGKK